jgi:hypothetical protein
LTSAGTRFSRWTFPWPLHELTWKALNLAALPAFQEEFGFVSRSGATIRQPLNHRSSFPALDLHPQAKEISASA